MLKINITELKSWVMFETYEIAKKKNQKTFN